MSGHTKQGWWYSATQEQKLAQIDGGIECGMTAREIALNCGASLGVNDRGGTIGAFAFLHGRNFPQENKNSDKRMARSREGTRVHHAKKKGELTDHHFNIFSLGDAHEATPETEELNF